ncbi:AAA family ATPase, partial [Nocardioides sp.]|uniref:AAA family ATPase n=1 Tax=Nocardioides sp. TaxID=35761 RepID=UPI002B26C27A
MNSWDRAQPLATVSAGRLVAALRACAPAVSFFADSPLSGVALHFQSTGQITLLASDGVCLAVRVEPAVVASTADAQIINVPGSTTSVLASFGEADVEIRLAQGTRSPLLLVRGEGAEVVEHELWSTRPQFDIYQAFTETSAGTTVSVAARELERAARVDCADGFTLAFTPGKLFVRTSAGLAGSPVSAVVSGASTRVALSPELLRHGWTFARAGASRGASSLVIEVLHDARILKIYGHDTDSQTFGSDDFYLSATGFRFAEFNTWLGLCETHVPGTPPAEATHPADPPAHPSGPAQVIDVDTVLAKLDAITGQAELKQQVKRLSAQVRLDRERQELGLRTGHPGTHMIFTGPPGTGKTTVARLIAELLHALGVLPEPRVVEVDKAGLVAAHVGGSEEKTTAAIQSAIGGVLFIDEAYALAEDQFGRSAIDVLLKALEDRRGEFVCIVAGYTDRMNEFVASNPGIRSRFLRTIDFTPYSTDELVHIGCAMATQVDNELDSGAVDALSARLRTEERRGTFDTPEWGNARSVRNVVDAALAARDLRIEIQEADEASAPVGPGERRRLLTTLTAVDIDQACDEFRIGVGGGSGESVEDVLAELGRQVGQEQLKRQVEVLLAGARAARLRADQGLESGRPDLPH